MKWVTSEVLPSIRKTGSYVMPTDVGHKFNNALTVPKGVSNLDTPSKGGSKSGPPSEINNQRSTIYVNESGLYTLIFTSKLESAKTFMKWVTSEVLPSI